MYPGAAVSIKWTAATFVALPLLVDGVDFLRRRLKWHEFAKTSALIMSMAMLVYASVFYIHFSLLPLSGTGNAFMSQEFRMGLEGNRYTENQRAEPQLSFVQKFCRIEPPNVSHQSTPARSSLWQQVVSMAPGSKGRRLLASGRDRHRHAAKSGGVVGRFIIDAVAGRCSCVAPAKLA